MNHTIKPARCLEGSIQVDPDKSISHRAVLIAALAEGTTEIRNTLLADDVRRSLRAVSDMGLTVETNPGGVVRVKGRGLFGLEAPGGPLELGNSGTSMRLLLGVLAGQHFSCELHGDESLSKRPMDRVSVPLKKMGATVMGLKDARLPPMFIQGARLRPIRYELPVASAQVKSAILLAGLYANGVTSVREPVPTRDHTERMLRLFGANVQKEGNEIRVRGPASLSATSLTIMGDPSSAAFLIAGALILGGSRVLVEHVNLNPTRIGYVGVLKRMGANIALREEGVKSGEPFGTLSAEASDLKGVEIAPREVPALIDELPILMAVAVYAKGRTRIRGARELRIKETDRIRSMAVGLARMGVKVKEEDDGLSIEGGGRPSGASMDSCGDHRTAMSLAMAALGASGPSQVLGTECINTSFPSFWSAVERLRNKA